MSTQNLDNETLELIIGDSSPFVMELFDDRDEPETLSTVMSAVLNISEQAGSTPLLTLDSSLGELTINTSTNEITALMSQTQADSLLKGEFLGQLTVQTSDAGQKISRRFTVDITEAV